MLSAIIFKQKKNIFFGFVGSYVLISLITYLFLAPSLGRVPLSCIGSDDMKVQSVLYCALNRNYVTPELKGVLEDVAKDTNQAFPNTQMLILDASFPFITGFPLLPHLSHDDGEKVDIAFYYKDENGYVHGKAKSPIGYFAFEQGKTDCESKMIDLRWDLNFLQSFWSDLEIEEKRTKFLIDRLAQDKRISKVLIEPHLKNSLGLSGTKIRFQGCRAARHDDHIHIQL